MFASDVYENQRDFYDAHPDELVYEETMVAGQHSRSYGLLLGDFWGGTVGVDLELFGIPNTTV
jgi:hypothetical protein